MKIKQRLIELGMNENDFDNHYSDLYVRKNKISETFMKTFKYKNSVETFKSGIDSTIWYDIPFGYRLEIE